MRGLIISLLLALLTNGAEAFSNAHVRQCPPSPLLKHVSIARLSGATSLKMATETVDLLLTAVPGVSALALAMQKKSESSPISDTSLSAVRDKPSMPQIKRVADIKLARENFNRWNGALQTKSAATVAEMYDSSDLSFLPTVSPEHIKDGAATEDYFKAFVQKNPFGTITDDSIQVYNNGNTYLHSGMYTFELGEPGARIPVAARFSYVWKNIDGSWKISHHHSSVVPPSPPSPTVMLGTARANFNAWNNALQTKNAATVANMYVSDELSFLPTVSGEHIKAGGSNTDTEDYFKAFVQKNPFGTITDDSVQVYNGGNAYLHSGLYTFELGEGDARAPVLARFSYVWVKDGSDWKISHHHSSVRPESASSSPKEEPKAKGFWPWSR